LIATPILLPVMQNFGVSPFTYVPEISLWLARHVLR
jgi:hypothetical protein